MLAALLTVQDSDYSPRMDARMVSKQPDEERWIEAARDNDSAAFERLYRLHLPRVYGVCLRMTGNVSEAEDCTQDAFIQAWTQLAKFRGDSSFATWLHRIAVNSVLGRIRKSQRERDRINALNDVSSPPVSVADNGSMRDLSAAIDRLPEGARHVFVLYAVYGYSHEEAGGMLGIATGTSKAQLHRARRLLCTDLQKDGLDPREYWHHE